jgi:hypothetical protein
MWEEVAAPGLAETVGIGAELAPAANQTATKNPNSDEHFDASLPATMKLFIILSYDIRNNFR